MLLTVVTPSYNQARYLRATLDSVLGQDYAQIEHLVMDGASTDGTVDLLKSYDDPRLKWISEPDKGQTDAINKGLRQASGEVHAYLNSDDLYLPGAARFVMEYFAAHPEVDVLYGDCHMIDSEGRVMPPGLPGLPFNLRHLLTTRLDMPQPGVFWRRRVTEKVGLFDETLHYTMDYDYWIRMVAAGFTPVYVPGYRAAFRMHDASKTGTNALPFWHDWQAVIDKLYRRSDLPPEIARMKRTSQAYVNLYGAELLWAMDQKAAARPLLRKMITGGPWRPRVIGAAMLFDSYLGTQLAQWLRRAYSRTLA